MEFTFYGELSEDSACDSGMRNGTVHEDGTSERKRDGDLWLHMGGGGMNAEWAAGDTVELITKL